MNTAFFTLVLTVAVRSCTADIGTKCSSSKGEGYCLPSDDCYALKEASAACSSNEVCCPAGVSQQKCEEYGQYVYKEEMGAAMSVVVKIQKTSECYILAVPLVVGGEKTKPKEFPHMTAIGFGDDPSISWMCGGSLISTKHILSAAHCITSKEKGPAKWALVGTSNTEQASTGQKFSIVKAVGHPRYKPPSRYDDICIFVLDKDVVPDGGARPACLVYEFSNFKKALATGWGKLEYSTTVGSADLMKVELSRIEYDECNKTFQADVGGSSFKNGVMVSQICAGELAGGKDTCQGDSGGPLQVVLEKPYCMYSVVGVTSFGKFCGFKNSPAIYSKVAYYLPWIESVVWS